MSFTRYTNSQRPTVVMDSESILANTPGLPYIDVTSHVMLWELLKSHDWASSSTLILRPDETTVEVVARRVAHGPCAHFVLHFTDLEQVTGRSVESTRGLRVRPLIAGTAAKRPAVLVVDGPAGSGRATAVESLCGERLPGNSFEHVIADAAGVTEWTAAQTLLSDGADVVLRRAELIHEVDADQLSAVVDGHRSATITGKRTNTLLITVDRDRCCAPVLAILDEIGYAARTQPLALTPERIPTVVKRVLDQVTPGGRHTMSPAALQSFVQWELAGKHDRTRRNARSLGPTGAIVGDRA